MLALLLAEEVTEVVTLETQHRLISLFTGSDIIIQITLVLTLFFSIASWAIIGMKQKQLRLVKKRSDKFLASFWKTKSIENLIDEGSFLKCPAFNVFRAGITALKEHGEAKNMERITYAIRSTTDNEIESLDNYVPFLATTASAAPFLGLFGTVWGILNAFWKIGHTSGGTSMEVVGPNISEALSATALGLAAAIPAVIFYNYFVGRIRVIDRNLNQFAGDLENRIEDEYLKTAKQRG